MLENGNLNRTQHPTDANAQSSRSHAVFIVHVHQKPIGSGLK
jgi:kinesin family member 18/19